MDHAITQKPSATNVEKSVTSALIVPTNPRASVRPTHGKRLHLPPAALKPSQKTAEHGSGVANAVAEMDAGPLRTPLRPTKVLPALVQEPTPR